MERKRKNWLLLHQHRYTFTYTYTCSFLISHFSFLISHFSFLAACRLPLALFLALAMVLDTLCYVCMGRRPTTSR
jgi:hypothetical protein